MTVNTGVIQLRLTGQTSQIQAVYEAMLAALPPDRSYRSGVTKRDNGISQAYINVPADLFAAVIGGSGRPTTTPRPRQQSPGLARPIATDTVYDAELVDPAPQIGRRFKVTWRR
jgi:hypothetical protein